MEPLRFMEVYRECMRNHAATLGGYACDGCCEYTPDALRPHMVFCTACGCHRNFHRRLVFTNLAANIRMGTGADIFRLRRRRRTKFTAEQKARMGAFAARIGWKVRKQEVGEEDEVSRFCREIGISRQVFKNWIHNHKRRAAAATSASNTAAAPADAEGEGEEEGEGEGGGEGEGEEVGESTSVGEEK